MVNEIASFLDVVVQQRMIGDGIPKVVRMMDRKQIEGILPERPPQLYVDRAVFISANGGDESYQLVIASISVTEEMCKGHFEWFPMVPFALAGQAGGQAGSLVVLWANNSLGDNSLVPIAVQVKNIKSISEKKSGAERKDVAVPGDIMAVTAKYLGGRFGIHKVECNIFVDGARIMNLQELDIILVSRSEIISKGNGHG